MESVAHRIVELDNDEGNVFGFFSLVAEEMCFFPTIDKLIDDGWTVSQ